MTRHAFHKAFNKTTMSCGIERLKTQGLVPDTVNNKKKGRPSALPLLFDRPAPRKPRPEGRGQGELYKNGNLPYRVRKPAKRTPARKGGEASLSVSGKREKAKWRAVDFLPRKADREG
jgi:hypothetical protein